MSVSFHYYGSENPIKVGDRILIRGIFGRSWLATVVYIPGQSEPDTEIGDDQWAYKTDDGRIYVGGFFPTQFPHPGKKVEFVFRAGEEAQEVIKSYQIPPEEFPRQLGRNFLALIGCGTIIALIVVLFVAGFLPFFRR